MAKKDSGKTSKADMVRDAIAKLGWGAGIDEYQAYIKETYKIEMSKPHISQTKSNERKRHSTSAGIGEVADNTRRTDGSRVPVIAPQRPISASVRPQPAHNWLAGSISQILMQGLWIGICSVPAGGICGYHRMPSVGRKQP